MPDLVVLHASLSALAARSRQIGNDERGEVTIERTILLTAVVSLAITILVLGIPKLTHLLPGS